MEIKGVAGGPNRDALASALQDFLAQEFQGQVRREEQAERDPKRDGGILPVIALIVALPGAINQLITLAERAKLKERLDGLLTRIRGAAGPDDTAILQVGSGRQLDLKTATSGEVLNALEQAQKKA